MKFFSAPRLLICNSAESGPSFQSPTSEAARFSKWPFLWKVCLLTTNNISQFVSLNLMEFSYFLESQLASEDIPVCLTCQGVLKEPFVRCCSCVFKVELCLEVSHASVQSKLKLTFGYLVLFKVEQVIPGKTLCFFWSC